MQSGSQVSRLCFLSCLLAQRRTGEKEEIFGGQIAHIHMHSMGDAVSLFS